MSDASDKKTPETSSIEEAFRALGYAAVDAYRQNSASLRVRVVDDRFRGLSRIERDKMALPVIRRLPEQAQLDLTVLLLLTPEEQSNSMANLEFEQPVPSRL